MRLTKDEKKAIETLVALLSSENITDIIGHILLNKGFSAINDIVKKLPNNLKDEINKRLNK